MFILVLFYIFMILGLYLDAQYYGLYDPSKAFLVVILNITVHLLFYLAPIQVFSRTRKTPICTDEYKTECIGFVILLHVIFCVLYATNIMVFITGGFLVGGWIAAIIWGVLSYNIGKKYLNQKRLLIVPFFNEKLNLYRQFFSTSNTVEKQEILLAFASENARKYSFFTEPRWQAQFKEWFTALRTPELGPYNAYDVLLFLVSNKTTTSLAKSVISYYSKNKGTPSPKNKNEIISSINRYMEVWVDVKKMQNPVIEDELLQEIREQYDSLSSQAQFISEQSSQDQSINDSSKTDIFYQNNKSHAKKDNITVLQQSQPVESNTYVNANLQAHNTPSDNSTSLPQSYITQKNQQAVAVCPRCNTRVPGKSTFCYKCGLKMELIFCPECGKQINATTDTCPNCGYPVQEMLHSIT